MAGGPRSAHCRHRPAWRPLRASRLTAAARARARCRSATCASWRWVAGATAISATTAAAPTAVRSPAGSHGPAQHAKQQPAVGSELQRMYSRGLSAPHSTVVEPLSARCSRAAAWARARQHLRASFRVVKSGRESREGVQRTSWLQASHVVADRAPRQQRRLRGRKHGQARVSVSPNLQRANGSFVAVQGKRRGAWRID